MTGLINMAEDEIKSLTYEQIRLIPVYQEKWRKIALSTEPIDRNQAASVVKEAYALIGLPEPEFIFCDSPYSAWKNILLNPSIHQYREVIKELRIEFRDWLEEEMKERLNPSLLTNLNFYFYLEESRLIEEILTTQIIERFKRKNWYYYDEYVPSSTNGFINTSIKIDYYTSVIGDQICQNKWEILQQLVKNCSRIFPYAKICYICDRPRILSFDNEQRLHAEGAPAIQFVDGYSLYAYHGVTLPEKYGNIHPNNWQASWLLEEENAELRRVLIQGIGYERIASELGATELDSFQEYSLLKINTDIDVEPIYMLKMTCPSTGYIHVLRVPPDVKSAREAIRWVNWGVDPEEFSMQT